MRNQAKWPIPSTPTGGSTPSTKPNPGSEAVAIKDGTFQVVGSNAEVEAVTGGSTEVVDLGGAFAMPGLIDIHGFHGMSTENRRYCELKGTFWEPTEEQILADLRACA